MRRLSSDDSKKLAGLADILRVHDRQSVYAVVVIDVPQAFVGLHDRAIIVVSLAALRSLNAGEIQAQIAHEIGHEYVWDEYRAAKLRGDGGCLQQLELFCDAVGAITLHRAGLDHRFLVLSLANILAFNRQFGTPRNKDSYPPLEERKAFIRRVMAALQ